MMQYKCDDAGVWFQAVDEAYSTQTYSNCGQRPQSRLKGIAGLRIREWQCDACGSIHDPITGHAYVVDLFLHFMARRGYTLQRSRHQLPFRDLEMDVERAQLARSASLSAGNNADAVPEPSLNDLEQKKVAKANAEFVAAASSDASEDCGPAATNVGPAQDGLADLALEIYTASQRAPGEGIEEATNRIEALLKRGPLP